MGEVKGKKKKEKKRRENGGTAQHAHDQQVWGDTRHELPGGDGGTIRRYRRARFNGVGRKEEGGKKGNRYGGGKAPTALLVRALPPPGSLFL